MATSRLSATSCLQQASALTRRPVGLRLELCSILPASLALWRRFGFWRRTSVSRSGIATRVIRRLSTQLTRAETWIPFATSPRHWAWTSIARRHCSFCFRRDS
eukprot:Amastigsp_a340411_13.p5 type:complete len:103 gc:universal Amastigsp_a340411_13:926-618(-)